MIYAVVAFVAFVIGYAVGTVLNDRDWLNFIEGERQLQLELNSLLAKERQEKG